MSASSQDGPPRIALVTGASRGIGLALAETLAGEGFGLTLTARNPDRLDSAARQLREEGFEVEALAANMADEDAIKDVVRAHRERFGRLDVLVNNAGVGIGAAADEHQTKFIDMQLGVNLRAIVIAYRECIDLLRAAGAEHHNALVVNMSSISGKSGEPWLSVYSATKAAVVGFTQAMNKELGGDGIKSCALCPAFVDTPMTEFVKQSVAAEDMIRPDDVVEAVRMLLRLSPACVVPEIMFEPPGMPAGLPVGP